MACDCDNWIDCKDKPREVGTYSEHGAFEHKYSNVTTCDNVLEIPQSTIRDFSVVTRWDRHVGIDHIVTGCGGPIQCDDTSTANPYAAVSESCERISNVPYYWDQQRGIYVWKSVTETLKFSISSNKTATFRMKWGTGKFHKVCIPTSVRVNGREEFFMVKDGIKVLLAGVTYDYNPFPVTDIKGGNWGLYGNVVNTADAPETPDVACILVFPTVPKLALCQDADCLFYGFYDYNAVDGGFTENSLSHDDGGKDYFYPYWCRSMPTDPLWREVADTRYEVIYSGAKTETGGVAGEPINLEGVSAWIPDEPVAYSLPFGSLVLNSKAEFIASCILQFGEHAGSKGVVYNEASMGDLFAALTNTGVTLSGPYTALHPVTPL